MFKDYISRMKLRWIIIKKEEELEIKIKKIEAFYLKTINYHTNLSKKEKKEHLDRQLMIMDNSQESLAKLRKKIDTLRYVLLEKIEKEIEQNFPEALKEWDFGLDSDFLILLSEK